MRKMKSPRTANYVVLGLSILFVTHPNPASAQYIPDEDSVIARACAGMKGKLIDQEDIATAMLVEDGRTPFKFLMAANSAGFAPTVDSEASFDSAIYSVFQKIREARSSQDGDGVHPLDNESRLAAGMEAIEVKLRKKDKVSFQNGHSGNLFQEGKDDQKILCVQGRDVKPFLKTLATAGPAPVFAIREKAEELWLGGKEGRKAGAFELGFTRTNTIEDDLSKKKKTNIAIDGTVGLRITTDRAKDGETYLFGTYKLNQDRVVPKPKLDEGKSQSDDDTDVLEVGLISKFEQNFGRLPVDLFLQSSWIVDFANDAERLKVKVIAAPGFVKNFGFCNFGSLRPLTESGKLRTRCSMQFEAEGAGITKRGTTEIEDFDTFLAVGVTGKIEAFLPTSDGNDTGFFASAKYRFLPVIHGPFSNIERFELEFKHRFWTDIGMGVDLGLSYTKGTNELSYDDENVLKFGAGVIF